jgi:ribose-phosphate pyrophosphokinase
VAELAGCPYTVLSKVRSGDHEVAVSLPPPQLLAGRTPVLVDDIASTARTMVAATGQLKQAGAAAPICIAVHALFAGDAYSVLQQAGVAAVVSCNTVPHASNGIDLMPALAAAAQRMLTV